MGKNGVMRLMIVQIAATRRARRRRGISVMQRRYEFLQSRLARCERLYSEVTIRENLLPKAGL